MSSITNAELMLPGFHLHNINTLEEEEELLNGSQLAKMKKYIPYMSMP